jgi:GT2 family glycosyltransferase
MTASPRENVGVVIIGRNEGARLVRCLASLRGAAAGLVYVDSGSTDDSVAAARSVGADVVLLDTATPFTAARARNAGFERLSTLLGDALVYVQFVDGDCALDPDWIATATDHLEAHPEAAVACGRRREQRPEHTIYNRLCDMEWNTRVGLAAACGGDSLMRAAAFRAVGGFDPTLIAGEEPDLCFRLRERGCAVWRIDAEMTRHDAAMERFGQWWRRAVRGGWAYAEGYARHGDSPERYNRGAVRSILAWTALGPVATTVALAATVWNPWALSLVAALAALHGAQAVRIAIRRRGAFADPWPHALLYGVFTTIGKWPQSLGVLRYAVSRLRKGPARLIEYK